MKWLPVYVYAQAHALLWLASWEALSKAKSVSHLA
jgi:hypothetical protein